MAEREPQNFNICQININGMSKKSSLALDKYANDNFLDIICLQETKLTEATPPLTNYSVHCKNKRRNAGGVGIFVKNGVNHTRVPHLESGELDVIWLIVQLKGWRLLVSSAYIPPNNPDLMDLWLANLKEALSYANEHRIKGTIAVGDFNARSLRWDKISNGHGLKMTTFLDSQQQGLNHQKNKNVLSVMAPHQNTFSSYNGGSVIDIAICSYTIKDRVTCQRVDTEVELFTGSPGMGHYPVISSLNLNQAGPQLNKRRVYDFKRADWNRWSGTLELYIREGFTQIQNLTDGGEAHELWLHLKTLINMSNDNCLPQKLVCQHSKPFWSSALSRLSKSVRAKRKTYKSHSSQVNKQEYLRAKGVFETTLETAYDEFLQNEFAQLNVGASDTFWRRFNRLSYGANDKAADVDILQQENTLYTTDEDKSRLLQETFFTGKHLMTENFDNTWKQAVENDVRKFRERRFVNPISDDGFLNNRFTFSELKAATKQTKSAGKSIDQDGFHPRMIKAMGFWMCSVLLEIANIALQSGKWPWPEAKTIFLKKTGKDAYNNPNNYRPITITSYFGKLVERMIANRLQNFFCQHNLIDKEQEGFVTGKSSHRYLSRLACILHSEKAKGNIGAAIFCDLEKAFDSVWLDGLIHKLYNANVTGPVLSLLHSYLNDRAAYIRVGKYTSQQISCILGVPQGSVLSPLLFIFYIADMLSSLTHTSNFKYADDCTVFISKNNTAECRHMTQECCHQINNWCHRWRLKINCQAGKTEVVTFAPPNMTAEVREWPKFRIGLNDIEFVDHSKVLGLHVDSNMCFDTHAVEVKKKAWKKWSQIKRHCYRYGGMRMATIITIVKAIVIPTILYAATAWIVRKHTFFDDIFYDILKTATASGFYPARDKLEIVCGMPPLDLEITKLTIKFILKVLKLPEGDLVRNAVLEAATISRHPFRHHTAVTKSYLYKHKNILIRNDLDLFKEAVRSNPTIIYTRKDMDSYISCLWGKRLRLSRQANGIDMVAKAPKMTPINLPLSMYDRDTERVVLCMLHGQGGYKSFLHRIGVVDTDMCDCGLEEQSREHLLLNCPLVNQRAREAFREHLGKIEVEDMVWEEDDILMKLLCVLCQDGFIKLAVSKQY